MKHIQINKMITVAPYLEQVGKIMMLKLMAVAPIMKHILVTYLT